MAQADSGPKISVSSECNCELPHYVSNKTRVNCSGCRTQVLVHQDVSLADSQHFDYAIRCSSPYDSLLQGTIPIAAGLVSRVSLLTDVQSWRAQSP